MHVHLSRVAVSSICLQYSQWDLEKGWNLYGKQDEMKGHMLEVELLSLDPRNYDRIQDFFTKYNDLLLQLKGCGIDKSKEESHQVLSIMSKLGPE